MLRTKPKSSGRRTTAGLVRSSDLVDYTLRLVMAEGYYGSLVSTTDVE